MTDISLTLSWPQPLSLDHALGLLRALAADSRRGPVTFEARALRGRITYGVRGLSRAGRAGLAETIPNLRAAKDVRSSADLSRVARLRLVHPTRPLDAGDPVVNVRTVLAALASLAPGHDVLVQIVVGKGRSPYTVPRDVASPWQPWLSRATHGTTPADASTHTRLQRRADEHLLRVDVRFATSAPDGIAEHVIRGLLAASRIIERDGPRFRLSSVPLGDVRGARPPRRYPLTLTAPELLVLLGWPVGSDQLPGQSPKHPRVVVPRATLSAERAFAETLGTEPAATFGISASEAKFHTHILGPTGSGKSTILIRSAVADMHAGQSVVVVDPKADTVAALLARIPESRLGDVVVLDLASANPVPFNPLDPVGRDPYVVADSVVDILSSVFTPLGPRTLDVINNATLTLTLTGGTLVDLPDLLLDSRARQARVVRLDDPVLLGFWARYEQYSHGQVLDVVGPTMSRLRRVLLRPGLRKMFGASRGFSIDELFARPTILLVPTNRGSVGPQAAGLLGSLVIATLWNRVLAQASMLEPRRRPLTIYVDEFQEFVRMSGNGFADALAQSRSLNTRWNLANQYLGQVSPEMRAAVEVNARNKVAFALTSSDARAMAAESAELEAEDFRALNTFEIYARLTRGGTPQPWISGRTLPLPPVTSDPIDVLARSSERWPAPSPTEATKELASEEPLADAVVETGDAGTDQDDAGPVSPRVGRVPRRRP